MKLPLLLTAAFFCSVPALRADVEVTMAKLREIGYLPQDKADLRPEDKLDIKRRNPFAERKKAVAARPTEQVETEESKIRTFFDKQKVSGYMKIGDKTVVTVGRLSLEAGQLVPPIIPNQTNILRVLSVTDSELEIGWVEETGTGLEPAVPRKIRKKINLRPTVDVLVVSSDDNTGENRQTYAQDDTGKIVMPRQNVFPNPSEIIENLPPGSDINLDGVLSENERQLLSAAENSAGQQHAPLQPPPAPPSGGQPRQAPVPDAAPPPSPNTPSAPESTEDGVQPDPDLAEPPSASGRPAGPPGK